MKTSSTTLYLRAFFSRAMAGFAVAGVCLFTPGCLVKDKAIQFTSKTSSKSSATIYYISYGNSTKAFPISLPVSELPTTNLATPVTYAVTPTLPLGVTFNTSTGALGGTPSSAYPATDYLITGTSFDGTTANVTLSIRTGTESMTVTSTVLSSNITTDSFKGSVTYTGDIDDDATCDLWMCSNDTFPGCDPSSIGPFMTMARTGGGVFEATFSNMASLYAAHNIGPLSNLNIEVLCSDPDGVSGANQNSTAQLSPIPPLTVSTVNISSILYNGFTVTATISGDIESTGDSSCTLYYCNHTDSPGCNPTAGSSAGLARAGSTYSVVVPGLAPPDEAGDSLNWRVHCNDPDGASGLTLIDAFNVDTTGTFSLAAAPAPTVIYRSVGPSASTDIATGIANPMTIAGTTATFTSPLPNIVGVGDVIQYDTSNGVTINAIGIIHERFSSTSFDVRTANGIAGPSAVAGNTSWSIYRAYTSVNNAVSGSENSGIDINVRNFDTFSGGKNIGLYGGTNESWNIALYANSMDTSNVNIGAAWVGGTNNYLRIYAPSASNQVGTSQRHAGGVWDNTKSRIVTSLPGATISISNASHVKIEGLQIQNNYNTGAPPAVVVAGASVQKVVLFANVLQTAFGGGGDCVSIQNTVNIGANPFRLYGINNVASACDGSGFEGYGLAFLYNNTVYFAGDTGIFNLNASLEWNLKNNLVIDSVNLDYDGSAGGWDASSDRNAASDNTGPNAPAPYTSLTSSVFVSAPSNLLLNAGASALIGQGLDLSADPALPFSIDIQGISRGPVWDIGADEF